MPLPSENRDCYHKDRILRVSVPNPPNHGVDADVEADVVVAVVAVEECVAEECGVEEVCEEAVECEGLVE